MAATFNSPRRWPAQGGLRHRAAGPIEAGRRCINSRHPGPLSKLRKHLYEAVGMLLDSHNDADRLIAAVPRHAETERVAKRMEKRCHAAGIEIALVSGDGSVRIVE